MPSLVSAAVMLPVGWILALAIFFSLDPRPDEYFGEDFFIQNVALLVLLAVPGALLVAWGEIDLSVIGLVPLGGALYTEVGGESLAGGLLVAAAVGLGAGAAIGVVRWLTQAPSALLSLGAGFLASGVAFRVVDPRTPVRTESRITDWGLPVALALGVVLLVVVAALVVTLLTPGSAPGTYRRSDGQPSPNAPDLRVIPGFALSGLAVALNGGVLAGIQGGFVGTNNTFVVLSLFAAIAVGGVASRGNALVAPMAVLAAVPAVVLLNDSVNIGDWRFGDQFLILGGLVVVGLVVANGSRRLLGRPA